MSIQYAKDQPAGYKNHIENVAIVGAGGYLGKHFATALLKTGKHTVTALTRADSKNTLPEGVLKAIIDYDDHKSLVAALKGKDFLILTLNYRAGPHELTKKLATAAAEAGVKWVMPNGYGPNPYSHKLHDAMGFGPAFRQTIAGLKDLGLKPVVLSCGFWYEFSLAGGLERYGFDIANRKFVAFDKGDVKINTSTLPQCGRSAAAVLSLPILPEDSSSSEAPTLSSFIDPKPLIVRSFHVSQNDIFASLKRVTGTTDADWTITTESSYERWNNATKVLQAGGGFNIDGITPMSSLDAFVMVMYSPVFFPGGDGVAEEDVANDRLGLPQEDLDEWTKEAVRIFTDNDLATYGQ